MEDTEMLDQDLQKSSDTSLADASLEQNESAKLTENQKSGEKESDDDKSVTLHSDVELMDNQVVSDEPDNAKSTSVDESLIAKDDNQMMENKNNEDSTHVENIHEADVAPDLVDNQVLSSDPDNSKVTSVDGSLSAKDDEHMMESESNEDGTHIENDHEADESHDLTDNKVLSKESDNNEAPTDENLSANIDDQITENKSNGDDGTHVENNHETDVSGDLKLTDNQVLSKETDNNKAADGSANNGDQMVENKSNGDNAHVEKNHDSDAASDPLPISVIMPPEVKHDETVRKINNWLNEDEMGEAGDTGTPEEVAAFMKELETFHRVNALDYKPPKFYGEPLNCLKLWRAVIRLGGYELVTASKLWRQVGESFHPPKTCTTVSWTFRIFYEKALLEFEKHMRQNGQLPAPATPFTAVGSVEKDISGHQASGSGRQRRDAASRAMQGWHSQRNLGNGEVGEPIIKDKNANSSGRREKHLKSIGLPKHKTSNNVEFMDIPAGMQAHKQLIPEVVDIGPPADWVKINVRESKDCYEVYALVPGLLREEVRVQSDPVGRLVITGQPEQVVNPWGITPFKKVVNLPGRIDPLRTSALVSLHGRLFVRVPFERETT